MSNIDRMRYKAVQELERLGYKFVENKWCEPTEVKQVDSTSPPTDMRYYYAFWEIADWIFKQCLQHTPPILYINQYMVKKELETIIIAKGLSR